MHPEIFKLVSIEFKMTVNQPLFTSIGSFQTSNCGLRTDFRRQTSYRRQTSEDSDNLFVTQQKQTYICSQIS